MSKECDTITQIFNDMKRCYFPFEDFNIPKNGIYVLFQKYEKGHGSDRVVRVGTHTGINQLLPRLKQHFLFENKDRSIFRKNIGRALLNKRKDPFLKHWELDLTTREAKHQNSHIIDFDYQNKIEHEVSEYMRLNFSFVVFEVEQKEMRLELEKKIISTVSLCNDCYPSSSWLGNYSTKIKIEKSGLWLVNELYKTPFDNDGIKKLNLFINKQPASKLNNISNAQSERKLLLI